jgi:hypothetical protein
MKSRVSSGLRAPSRMTPNPLQDSARALTGSCRAISSASAREAVSIVTRTDMTPSPSFCTSTLTQPPDAETPLLPRPLLVELAAQPPAANADVREEQDDEDDCENDVQH